MVVVVVVVVVVGAPVVVVTLGSDVVVVVVVEVVVVVGAEVVVVVVAVDIKYPIICIVLPDCKSKLVRSIVEVESYSSAITPAVVLQLLNAVLIAGNATKLYVPAITPVITDVPVVV